ncbi:Trk system potassium transporter TrkA [Thiohalorhabdus methylotrophus]|uniref:Trk system potassium uptake protein TrkA n=1 Tax=Thiohalorhabdus methylotrophus TaxID=3242694 RepID=A0ABV4TPS9_9GAMM
MKIVILGAGQVGSPVAEQLALEGHDVTVVDQDGERLSALGERLDIQTVAGQAAYPHILEEAGMGAADMVLAVTATDEVNMVACQMAETLFHTPTKLARLRAPEYLSHPELFNREAFPVDFIISPEQVVTDSIHRLIEHPGSLQVVDFAGGRVRLVGVRADADGPLVGHQLQELRHRMPGVDTRVAAIYRRGQALIPEGQTVIEEGDEVFFIAAREYIQSVLRTLRAVEGTVRGVVIVGGGKIGSSLAKALERTPVQVKLIDHNASHAAKVAAGLKNTLVLHGDGADEELLREENIGDMNVFVAVTNDDEANILSSMLAKRMGVQRAVTLINRGAYVDLVQQTGIDVAVSPHQATIGRILAHVRRGDVAMVHSLRRGAAEALEVLAHGDASTSRVIGKRLDEIRLPKGVTIGAIVRGDQVLIAHRHVVIEPEDHVILFLVDKRKIVQVEKLFQVGLGFF